MLTVWRGLLPQCNGVEYRSHRGRPKGSRDKTSRSKKTESSTAEDHFTGSTGEIPAASPPKHQFSRKLLISRAAIVNAGRASGDSYSTRIPHQMLDYDLAHSLPARLFSGFSLAHSYPARRLSSEAFCVTPLWHHAEERVFPRPSPSVPNDFILNELAEHFPILPERDLPLPRGPRMDGSCCGSAPSVPGPTVAAAATATQRAQCDSFGCALEFLNWSGPTVTEEEVGMSVASGTGSSVAVDPVDPFHDDWHSWARAVS